MCIAPGVGWCLPPSTERIIKLPDTVLSTHMYVCFVRPLSFFLAGGGRPRSVSIDFTNDAPRRAILPAAACCSWAQAYWWLRWQCQSECLVLGGRPIADTRFIYTPHIHSYTTRPRHYGRAPCNTSVRLLLFVRLTTVNHASPSATRTDAMADGGRA